MPWLPYIFNRNPTTTAPTSIMHEEDEEWSHIGSEDDDPHTRTETNDSPRRGERVYTQEDRALLPYMPSLFSDALPPCGLITQIAYENVVQRLRKVWLQRAVNHPVNIHVLDLCKQIAEELSNESDDQPIDSQFGTKARRPWRRENVFNYEISWAVYFMREADMLEKKPKMTEAELDKQEFMEKLFPIPKELGIYVKNNLNKDSVMGMWRAWHHKKRGTEPQEGTGLGVGGAKDDKNDDAERIEDVDLVGEGRADVTTGTA